MMHSPHARRWLAPLLLVLIGMTPPLAGHAAERAKPGAAKQAAQAPAGAQSEQFVDGIAAVVNKQVITLHQVDVQAQIARAQMQHQNIPVPPDDILRKQVLQRMITQELERQEAERAGIRVSDEQVQHAVQTIAQRNGVSVDKMRQDIEKSGTDWSTYLGTLKDEISLDMLRQRAVDSTIHISEGEIDAFLRSHGDQLGARTQPAPAPSAALAAAANGPLGLAQILVAVPEGASQAQEAELRKKAESLLAQVRGGKDFAGVAAASSDGPEALDGGNLGVRPVQGWPDLFINATRDLGPGQISGILRSGNGFHILKVLSRGGSGAAQAPSGPPTLHGQASAPAQSQGPMIITQTHARHILIKTSKVMTDEQARERLLQLRQRILNGESFAELAKRNSEDASAPQGGDLGWLSPGETVPAFERVMNTLQPNQVSEPVHTQFGWHLIQVLGRREKDVGEEYKRMQARKALFERRVEPAFEDWLGQLRGRAYIDNRLDPSTSSSTH